MTISADVRGKKIYCMGICGTGMGSLAGLLKSRGAEVWGSDENVYPPMSEKLAEWGIRVCNGYDVKNLDPSPDLVVIGNIIRKTNLEAQHVLQAGLAYISMPEAIAQFGIGERQSIVVTGTHGKTTTTAILSHVLEAANLDPSYLVGGALVGYPNSFKFGSGNQFVVEGDEYDTSFFDKGPKFRHYRPDIAILTSLEFDHADIFSDVGAVENAFKKLLDVIPEKGCLVVWGGAKRALSLLKGAHYGFSVVRYGEGSDADDFECYGKGIRYSEEGCFFDVNFRGRELLNLFIPLWGRFAVQNVLAAVAVLLEIGLSEVEIREGLATYPGVRRRLEVCATWGAGVIVVDDFGHHPTAIKETLQAARQRWPNRRLWALYEPRSATARRNVLERELQNALLGADCVVIASHERLMEIPEAERFSPVGMAEALCLAGLDAWSIDEPALIVKHLQRHAEREDVVVMFSNGSFGGLRELLSKT